VFSIRSTYNFRIISLLCYVFLGGSYVHLLQAQDLTACSKAP